MKISVFGLGYVGTVSAVCFAKEGYEVIGVDKNPLKVEQLKEKKSPILEPGLETLIEEVIDEGKLSVTTKSEEAVLNSDVTIISVGTYSSADGSANLRSLYKVMEEIGRALKKKEEYHSIIIRSTVPPGTTEVAMRHVERASGKRKGVDFGGGMNPEFLREGSALDDFKDPPFVIVGSEDGKTVERMREIYQFLNVPLHITETPVAELLKYSCNAFHALKVAFGNEMGRICAKSGIDGQELMEILVKDKILNISEKYLKPGVPFGGSCLPKDLKGLVAFSKSKGAYVPLLDSILSSNDTHLAHILNRVDRMECPSIGVLGITFKENTDDLRESPILKIVRCLIDRGYEVKVHDSNLEGRDLIGSNKEILERILPEFSEIKVDNLEDIFSAQLVIFTNGQYKDLPAVKKAVASRRCKILDLNGSYKEFASLETYSGLCW